ncbi:MAG: hypothetical protein U0936_26590 [Planctomycetaceae bacterium]
MLGIWIIKVRAVPLDLVSGWVTTIAKPRVAFWKSAHESKGVITTSRIRFHCGEYWTWRNRTSKTSAADLKPQTIPVTKMTVAEVRVTEAELRLAEALLDGQKIEQGFATLVEQHERLLEFARKQHEAGIVPESEVRQSEAALLEIQRRWIASRKSRGVSDNAAWPGIDLTRNSAPETPDTLSAAEPSQPKPTEPSLATNPFDAIQAQQHQEAWAQFREVPVEISNSVGMKLRLIPPGKFQMGSTKEELEKLREELEHSNASNFDKFIAQSSGCKALRWHLEAVLHGLIRSDRQPVSPIPRGVELSVVCWNSSGGQIRLERLFPSPMHQNSLCAVLAGEDATAFCEWLSEKTAGEVVLLKYSLPDGKLQWEFVCRVREANLFGHAETRWRRSTSMRSLVRSRRKVQPQSGSVVQTHLVCLTCMATSMNGVSTGTAQNSTVDLP